MMNLTNMRIGKRLAVGFGMSAVFMLAMAVVAWWGMATMDQAASRRGEEKRKANLAQAALADVATASGTIMAMAQQTTPEGKAQYQRELDGVRTTYGKKLQELRAAADTDAGKQQLAAIEAPIADWRSINNQVVALTMQGNNSEAMKLALAAGRDHQNTVESAFRAYIDFREGLIAETSADHDRIVGRVHWTLGILSLLAVGLNVVFGILITRSISQPLAASSAFLERISGGDVTHDVTAELLARKDEVGDLGRSMQTMSEKLRHLLRDISGGVQTVASSATQLTAASTQTASGVKSMSEKSATVAAAAEESCATTDAVSSSMERASANLTSVAGATEEMSSTVAEIASNSEKARLISEKAMAQAQTISTMMAELGRAAQEIGKVTETITDISAQTNLLALNATIEAARAGSAGKGFAVVANEIKELAKQTSEATEDIKAKIAGVQNSTTDAVRTIETITGVIQEIGNTVASTAAAIEEQATVTKNVAGEIAEATAVVREVNDQVAQTATVSRTIASDIASVNGATAGIREGGQQVETSAVELSHLSEQLRVLVAQFSV
ncbi:MAG: methyl-accepting chemotaxis protein [Candidatus Korobacteraceae bacterium]|jgi:methyl-accepting chemotaxis protein